MMKDYGQRQEKKGEGEDLQKFKLAGWENEGKCLANQNAT